MSTIRSRQTGPGRRRKIFIKKWKEEGTAYKLLRLPITRYSSVRAGRLELAASGGSDSEIGTRTYHKERWVPNVETFPKSEDEVPKELKDGSKKQRGRSGLSEG